jgi:hypothetical protein
MEKKMLSVSLKQIALENNVSFQWSIMKFPRRKKKIPGEQMKYPKKQFA